MREYITGYVVANVVRMERAQFEGTFLIVEGDTDALVYERFSDRTECHVIEAHGKDNVVEALHFLDADGFDGALGIVDADFWILECAELPSVNLLLTDTYDLETMMLQSDAFDKVIAEFGSRAKIERFRTEVCDDLRKVLLDAGQVIGFILLLSLRLSLALKFEDLKFNKFVDKDSLRVDRTRAVQTVLDRSTPHGCDPNTILVQVDQLMLEGHDPWQVCCGHDLVGVLSLALRHAIGSQKAEQVAPPVLERSLRLAYEMAHFRGTALFRRIVEWEGRNPGFRVCAAFA